jgi:hypothetical protein
MDRIVDCLRDRLDLYVDETGEKTFRAFKNAIVCILIGEDFLFSNGFK